MATWPAAWSACSTSSTTPASRSTTCRRSTSTSKSRRNPDRLDTLDQPPANQHCANQHCANQHGAKSMTFTDLMVQQTINGLSLGAMYALLALGFTLVYGILELINFSHFNVFMIGSFVAMWTLQMFGLSGQDVILTGLSLAGVLLVAF